MTAGVRISLLLEPRVAQVLLSATLGNWGLFSAELLEDSYQLLGMAEAGLAPKVFAERHSKLRTPINAILLQLLIIGASGSTPSVLRHSLRFIKWIAILIGTFIMTHDFVVSWVPIREG